MAAAETVHLAAAAAKSCRLGRSAISCFCLCCGRSRSSGSSSRASVFVHVRKSARSLAGAPLLSLLSSTRGQRRTRRRDEEGGRTDGWTRTAAARPVMANRADHGRREDGGGEAASARKMQRGKERERVGQPADGGGGGGVIPSQFRVRSHWHCLPPLSSPSLPHTNE